MSIDGISAQALRYWEQRQATVANNLANVATPGFKGERVFAQLLDQAGLVAGSRTDHSAGALAPTGRTLDVALVGEGFLVVETPDGDLRWARGGALSLSPEGTLVDSAGRQVLGRSGPIVVPPGEVEITDGGTVRIDGEVMDQLRLERPTEGEAVERRGASLWMPTDLKEVVPEAEIQVRQGHLEESNVDPVRAMVEMIEIQRAYTAVQRSMQTEDSVMQSITTQIGRIG